MHASHTYVDPSASACAYIVLHTLLQGNQFTLFLNQDDDSSRSVYELQVGPPNL